MYKKILLPYDFANTFDNVPDQLVKLTENNADAVITILNIVTDGEMSGDDRFNGKSFRGITKERGEKLKPFTDRLDERGLNYEVRFEAGRVITELLKEIKENEYDIILMSNRRSKMELKHVLGHVTHKIAKRVNTPVMIIK
ncbi:MAG TPA: universal stress protein [Candidatus Salinicoccus stercoripullorum]|uniref:Universal stress protein n=1 Tax=Candidatus Salinicoccus stercoripullorum TaxID=2838756 RepID=A0A9D1TYJ2_9STAP|nr:universal stress protein [Candidatus Salinicoccus stercoripullorum]